MTLTDNPKKRIIVDKAKPPSRTPAEMLAVMTDMVNREVQALFVLTEKGSIAVPTEHFDHFKEVLELVCKLSREDRQAPITPLPEDLSKLSDEEIAKLLK